MSQDLLEALRHANGVGADGRSPELEEAIFHMPVRAYGVGRHASMCSSKFEHAIPTLCLDLAFRESFLGEMITLIHLQKFSPSKVPRYTV